MAGSVPAPQHSSPYSAPTNCEGGALQGASTPGAQPGSRVQSSSSSITEDNSELVDTGTVASSSRLSQADENGPVLQRPAITDSTAGPHDLATQDLNGHAPSTQPIASKDCSFPVELMTSCVATLFMLQVTYSLKFPSTITVFTQLIRCELFCQYEFVCQETKPFEHIYLLLIAFYHVGCICRRCLRGRSRQWKSSRPWIQH